MVVLQVAWLIGLPVDYYCCVLITTTLACERFCCDLREVCLNKFRAELAMDSIHYVAAKATYIRLLHGKIGFFGRGGVSALAP